MKPWMLGMAVLVLAGCGGLKNTDPLSGLAGSTDPGLYGFESGLQGWGCSGTQGGSCNSATQAQGLSFAGQGSLQVLMNALTNHYPANSTCPGTDDAARASVSFTGALPDLSGRTVRAWIFISEAAAYSKDAPTQAQIFTVAQGSYYANGPGVNLIPGAWNEVTFAPVANTSGANQSLSGGTYLSASYTPSAIIELGIKIAPSGSAPCSFQFTGNVLIDTVSW